MARQRRPLTWSEETRDCAFCGAKAGERCVKPSGQLHYGAHKARRTGRPARRGTATEGKGER